MFKFASFAAAASLLAASAVAAPVQWGAALGGNGHWYEFSITTAQMPSLLTQVANGDFTHNGLTGYLATVTSAAELGFIETNRVYPGNSLWLGVSDAAVEGEWRWIGGPESGGLVDFAGLGVAPLDGADPNNNYAMMGNQDSGNAWKDAGVFSSTYYVIEYSEAATVVPLPAAAPLLAGGLGLLGWMTRRRRRS